MGGGAALEWNLATLHNLVLGFVLSLAIGLAAWRWGSLDGSGVLGAVLTGTPVFGLGGWMGGACLVAFFVTASLLSRLRPRPEGRRNLFQALANGGVAAVLAFWGAGPALVGSLAAANADTWATEVGMTAAGRPRLITTWRPVARGTSGAVTARGLLAALAGAACIALVAWLLGLPGRHALAALGGGVAGSLLDSVVGATVERHLPPRLANEIVNLACTTAGAAAAHLLAI